MTSDARLDDTIRAVLSWEAERSAEIAPPFDAAMRELAERLGRSSVGLGRQGLQRRMVVLLAAALLLAALVIGGVVAGFFGASAPDAFTRVECDVSGSDCAYTLFVVDGDGEHMVYPSAGADDVVIQHADWAPDGSELAFVAGTAVVATPSTPQGAEALAIYVIDRDGSSPRRLHVLAEDQGSCGLSWAPDARTMALCVLDWVNRTSSSRRATLMTIDAATGVTTALADGVVTSAPEWSPDGSWILYEAWDAGSAEQPTTTSAWIVRPDGSGRQQLANLPTPGDWAELPLTWAPDSQAIAIEGRSPLGEATIEVIRFDGTRATVIPRRDGVASYQSYVVDIEALAWSANDEIAYGARGNGFFELGVTSLSGESRTVIATDTAGVAFIAQGLWWSADGRELSWLAHDPAVLGYCVVTFTQDDQSKDERCFANSDSVAGAPGS
jgi:hypothetical protein